MKIADDFLEGKDDLPLLALPAPGDDLINDDTKSVGGISQQTGFSNLSSVTKMSERNFISINKDAAARTRMMLGQRKTDRLAPDQRERLEELVKDIDENIEALVKEKENMQVSDVKS